MILLCRVLENQSYCHYLLQQYGHLLHLNDALPYKYPWLLLFSTVQVTYGTYRKANLGFVSPEGTISSLRIFDILTEGKRRGYFYSFTGSQSCSEHTDSAMFCFSFLSKLEHHFPKHLSPLGSCFKNILREMELYKKGWVRGRITEKKFFSVWRILTFHKIGNWAKKKKVIHHSDSVHSNSKNLPTERLTEMPELSYKEVHWSVACDESKWDTPKYLEQRTGRLHGIYTVEYYAATKTASKFSLGWCGKLTMIG